MCFTLLTGLFCCLSVAASADQKAATGPADVAIETVGLYIDFASVPELLPFVKACGYNTLEFCDASTLIAPADREGYHARMVQNLRLARGEGLRAYIILLSNVGPMQSAGESLESLHFPPRDERRMGKRLDAIAEEVRRLKDADGFIFFAGDPGGDPTKQADLRDCLAMARRVKAIVAREAPRSEFILNSWSIAAWDRWTSPFTVDFWEKETLLTEQVLNEANWIGPAVGIEFPMHNYYRTLALKCYADAAKAPRLFPSRAQVDELLRRGTGRLWGWPYFLIDECDDGFTGKTWGQVQAETRYLHKVVADARRLGLNGLVGNLSGRSVPNEILNVYAFARFAKSPSATACEVVRAFAGLIADDASANDLAAILAFIENHSSWQASMPPALRMPALGLGDLTTSEQALARLRTVQVRRETRIPLPVKPERYLDLIGDRLKALSPRQDP